VRGGQIKSDTVRDDTRIVLQLVGESAFNAVERSVLEGAGRVGVAFADDLETGLVVGGGRVAGLTAIADVSDLVIVGAVGNAAVGAEREGDPVELALLAGLIVWRGDDAVRNDLDVVALAVYKDGVLFHEIADAAVVVCHAAGGDYDPRSDSQVHPTAQWAPK